MPTTPPACLLAASAESGVPASDLTTIAMMVSELTGEPYASTVTLAPHVPQGGPSAEAWHAHTWRKHMAQRRTEWGRGRVEPWPVAPRHSRSGTTTE